MGGSDPGVQARGEKRIVGRWELADRTRGRKPAWATGPWLHVARGPSRGLRSMVFGRMIWVCAFPSLLCWFVF